jgi:hypothetical protein
MTATRFMVDPEAFRLPFAREALPIGVIDLDRADDGPLVLPAFPLVGVGDATHPLAAQLDALVEAPVTLTGLVDTVCANPAAAAIAVQTLRLLDTLAIPAALVAESIAYGLLQGGGEHAAWREARGAAATVPAGEVLVSRDGGRLDIRMSRDGANNAIDRTMRDGLREAFELAALDPDIELVTLRGVGRVFSVGADLVEFGTTRDPPTAHAIRMATLPAHAIARCAEKLEVHVQGACVGSALEMAAFARRITAGPRAWFQLPELPMGVIPGAGGCVSVPRRIGRQRAALMILSGRRVDVRTALAWGLVDAIVDD